MIDITNLPQEEHLGRCTIKNICCALFVIGCEDSERCLCEIRLSRKYEFKIQLPYQVDPINSQSSQS